MTSTHKIVIIGTGFGGMYAMKSLAKSLRGKNVEITIIGKNNYFLFTPMLHEVATGVLSHHNAAVAIRELIPAKQVDFLMAKVQGIDRARQQVMTSEGEVPYDTLVIATGATTQYFGVPGAEEYGLPLKTMYDAIIFRARVVRNFEKAAHETDPAKRAALLSVAVVGGGPTGVELAAELAEMVYHTILPRCAGRIHREEVRITLVQRGAVVLGMLDAATQQAALTNLREKGVEVLLQTEVAGVGKDSVLLGDGVRLPAGLTAWVVGVRAHLPDFVGSLGAPGTDPQGRMMVDATLRSVDDARIYTIGDAALAYDAKGKPLPMLAQVAMRQGKYLGKAILLRLDGQEPKPFAFQTLGELVSVGQWRAVGNAFGIPVRGPLGWMMWKMVYLTKFVSFPKALKIMLDWGLGLVSPRDVSLS